MPDIVRYGSLYNVIPLRSESLTWDEVVSLLTSSIETPDKFQVPGFGAHTLNTPRRNVSSVTSVTMFVFDVDAGTVADVGECERLLREANQAAHFYSSHSHTAAKPAFRLVLPVTRPVTPAEYSGLRAALIHRFKIPCKPEQSGDTSRFWFLPSHKPGAAPVFETLPGNPVDVDALAPYAPPRPASFPGPRGREAVVSRRDFVPPPEPEPGTPVDVAGLREKIQARATRLNRSPDPDEKSKGRLLGRLLAGEPLAEHGARNETMARVAGMLAWTLPEDTPLSVYLVLIRPSLNAMVADGSKLTEDKVERMLVTALKKRTTTKLDIEEFRRSVLEQKAEFLASLRKQKESTKNAP